MVNLDEVINACKVLKAFCEENVSCNSCPVGDGFSCAFSFMDGYIEAIEEWIETMTKWHEAELKLMPISEEYWSSLERKEELIQSLETLQKFCKATSEDMSPCETCLIRESCFRHVRCVLSNFTKGALMELKND